MTRHFNKRNLLLACLLCLSLLGGDCNPTTQPKAQIGLPTVMVKLAGRDFTLEVADTDKIREVGLMYRDSMPKDHGMIFVFEDDEVRGFWMENTRIPLDIVFINSTGLVVSVKSMLPLDRRTTSSDEPAKFAIELNAGLKQELKLRAGDRVDVPANLKAH